MSSEETDEKASTEKVRICFEVKNYHPELITIRDSPMTGGENLYAKLFQNAILELQFLSTDLIYFVASQLKKIQLKKHSSINIYSTGFIVMYLVIF